MVGTGTKIGKLVVREISDSEIEHSITPNVVSASFKRSIESTFKKLLLRHEHLRNADYKIGKNADFRTILLGGL